MIPKFLKKIHKLFESLKIVFPVDSPFAEYFINDSKNISMECF